MAWEPIRKDKPLGAGPNLADYDRAVREFSWEEAQAQLAGLPGDGASTSRTRPSTGTRRVRGQRSPHCGA